jgi:hypothetical protein
MEKQERLVELHHIAQHQLSTLQKFGVSVGKLENEKTLTRLKPYQPE